MKKPSISTKRTVSLTTTLPAAKLAAVQGGAYEFYVTIKGTKQGDIKESTP